MIYIGIESLAVNALIKIYQEGRNCISFKKLGEYGLRVAQVYEQTTNDKVTIIFRSEDIRGFVIDYSRYFKIEILDGDEQLCLREGVNVEVLKDRFVWSISFELLKAMCSPASLEVL